MWRGGGGGGGGACYFFLDSSVHCHTGFLEGSVLVMVSTLLIELAVEFVLITAVLEVVVISVLATLFPLAQSYPC